MENNNNIYVSISNALEVVNSARYGTINLQFEDDAARARTEQLTTAVNMIAGGKTVFLDGDRLVCVNRGQDITLTEEDAQIWEFAAASARDSKVVKFQANSGLLRLMKKIAREAGVKFSFGSPNEYIFDGSRKVSAFQKIENALLAGDASIDVTEGSALTVRAYCSVIAARHGVKIRCSISGNKIKVFFREPTAQEAARQQIEDGLEELAWHGDLSVEDYNEIRRILNNPMLSTATAATITHPVVAVMVPDGKYIMNGEIYNDVAEDEEWESKGFNSEAEYLESLKKSEPHVEIVDGLKQYVVPGLEKPFSDLEEFADRQAVKERRQEENSNSMPEDDDF